MVDLIGTVVKEAFPELFIERQVVEAEQQFHRRLEEYKLNIELQQLHREDLRDLIELTVGRMDVYHLVGALLLEFTITFYCENRMFEAKGEAGVPEFVLSFFLMANLAAGGFLLLSVWLSMHASVASHSVGVRLLTSYARISVPTRKELEEVAKAPLVPMMDRLMALGRRVGVVRGQSPAGGPGFPEPGGLHLHERSQSSITHDPTSLHLPQPESTQELPDGIPESAAIQEGSKAVEDRDHHFRRFLKEQRRWLSYDAYARVAMSLGINEMLTAMSYFLVGAVAPKAPWAALLSLFGVQWLSVLLLRLDITEAFQTRWGLFAMLVSVPLPPLYVGTVLLCCPSPVEGHATNPTLPLWATPGYVLHAGWLVFIVSMLQASSAEDVKALPKQLRTVLYLDVLNLDQTQAEAAEEQQVEDGLKELRLVREELQSRIETICDEESGNGTVSAHRRDDATQELAVACRERLAAVKSFQDKLDPSELREIRKAERTLDYLAVWRRAPEIFANLSCFRRRCVKGWLNEHEKDQIESAYQNFLARCMDLHLGIVQEDASPSEDEDAEPSPGNWMMRGQCLAIAPEEEPSVHIQAPTECLGARAYNPRSVWIEPSSGKVTHIAPEGQDKKHIISFEDTFTALPVWTEEVLSLKRRMVEEREPEDDLLDLSPADRAGFGAAAQLERGPRRGADAELRAFHTGGEKPLLPDDITPPELLPGVIVRSFALGMAFLWLACGAGQVVSTEMEDAVFRPNLRFQPVAVKWPEPASLFEVNYLGCHETLKTLYVGGEYGLYSANWIHKHLTEVTQVSESSTKGIVCNGANCWALSHSALTPMVRGRSLPLEVPSSWRLMAAAWGSNGEVVLCGYDGGRVLVAESRPQKSGKLRVRFALRPNLVRIGHSSITKVLFADWETGEYLHQGNYTDVSAMQLENGGRSLFVLHGQVLDRWDLVEGRLEGRWALPSGKGRATAFCLREMPFTKGTDFDLLMAFGVANPKLLVARMPRTMVKVPSKEGWLASKSRLDELIVLN